MEQINYCHYINSPQVPKVDKKLKQLIASVFKISAKFAIVSQLRWADYDVAVVLGHGNAITVGKLKILIK